MQGHRKAVIWQHQRMAVPRTRTQKPAVRLSPVAAAFYAQTHLTDIHGITLRGCNGQSQCALLLQREQFLEACTAQFMPCDVPNDHSLELLCAQLHLSSSNHDAAIIGGPCLAASGLRRALALCSAQIRVNVSLVPSHQDVQLQHVGCKLHEHSMLRMPAIALPAAGHR